MSKKLPNNNLCLVPWFEFCISPDGSRHICCISHDKSSYDISLRQTEDNKRVCVDMLRGERPKQCEICWRAEESGMESLRNAMNPVLQQAFEKYGISQRPQHLPVIYDIKIGNVCNLACKMCSPWSSSKWGQLQPKLSNKSKLVVLPIVPVPEHDFNWFSNEQKRNALKKLMVASAKHHEKIILTVAGGEPMLNKHYLPFLESLDANTKSKLNVNTVTNCTIIPKNLKDVFSGLGSAMFSVSLDGIGIVNDYIRHPADYNTITENIHTIRRSGFGMQILCAFQAYNVLSFADISAAYPDVQVHYRNTEEPTILDVNNLPKDICQKGIQNAERLLESGRISDLNKSQVQMSIKKLRAVLDRQQSKTSEKDIIEYSESIDSITGCYLKDCIPDLYDMLKQNHE